MRQGDLFGGPVPATRPRSIFDDMDVVPAIGLDPRFAGLIRLAGKGYRGKRIESRTWEITHRGPLVVCATMGRATADDPDLGAAFAAARAELVPDQIDEDTFDDETSHLGVAVALVTVASVRHLAANDWPRAWFPAPGQPCIANGRRLLAWELTNIWPLRPFKVRCGPGLFSVPAKDVTSAAVLALPECADFRGFVDADLPGLGDRW